MLDAKFDAAAADRTLCVLAGPVGWQPLIQRPLRWLAAARRQRVRARELACIEPRLLADAGLTAERYLRS